MTFKEKVISSLSANRLNIYDDFGNVIAFLELIIHEDLKNEELIKKITNWRERHKACFLSEFKPTVERTRRWLKEAVVENEDRILFKIISTGDGIIIGHIGAINRSAYVEYDYYILGEKVPIRNFAVTVARQFLIWVTEIDNFDYVLGNVRSDNHHAIDFHIRTGFKIFRKTPLKRVDINEEEFKFEVDATIVQSPVLLIEIRAGKADLQ